MKNIKKGRNKLYGSLIEADVDFYYRDLYQRRPGRAGTE
jgi:hypothetical protein